MNAEQRKRKRRCEIQCKDHIFMLQTLKSNPSKYDIQVQFCPKFQRQPLPPQHTYPQFNNDFKFYTSAFILGVDKKILIKNEQQEIMDHQKQIRDSLEKHNQLIFPRPNSKHSLCSVCKEHYKNYYIHIASQEHRERIGLSQYNNHIKDLCNLYIHLWEGAEQRADQQAQQRAIMEEQRRQRQAEERLLHSQEESNQLLDCQKGEQFGDQSKEYEEYVGKQNYGRKQERSPINNEDTVPINGKGYKRGAPDRSLYEPPIRKRYTAGHFNPTHAARQRKERQYERERDKMMRGTEFQHFKKHFKPRPGNQNDVFIVLEPIQGPVQPTANQKVKQVHHEKATKKAVEEMPKIQYKVQIQKQQNEFLQQELSQIEEKEYFEDNKSDQIQQEMRQIKLKQMNRLSHQEGQVSSSQRSESSSSSRSSQKDNRTIKNQATHQKTQNRPDWKMDPRMQNYPYPYPPMHMHHSHYPPKHMQPGAEGYKQSYKAVNHQYPEHYKNMPQGYKGMPPYYYNPYAYPVYDPPYMRQNQKGFEQNVGEKQKGKNPEKQYDYQNHMPYHWPPYHPYYMPPIPTMSSQHGQQPHNSQNPHSHSQHPQHLQHPPHLTQTQMHPTARPQGSLQPPRKPGSNSQNPNNPYVGSTSININFPMYMCPPPPPHAPIPPPMTGMSYPVPNSRYPMHPMMNPYMGYQYGNQMNQQQRNGRQGQYQPGQQPQSHHYPQSHGSNQNNAYPHGQHSYQSNSGYSSVNVNHQNSSQPGQSGGSHPMPPLPYYYGHPYPHYQSPMGQQQSKNSTNPKQI